MDISRVRWGGMVFATIGLMTAALAQSSTPPPKAANNEAKPKPPVVEDKYVPPPHPLKKVGDHWTPYDPPPVPEGAQAHVIVAGDTLWGLSQKYFGDPLLWPNLWDANRWITYSHWIYPGDPLVVPGKPTVITEKGPEPAPAAPAPQAPAKVAPLPPPPPPPSGPALAPVADQQELLCAFQLFDKWDPTPFVISGQEATSRIYQAEGDIVYLSAGKDMGLLPGQEFSVVRADAQLVPHLQEKNLKSVYVHRLGLVKLIAVQPNSATAEIVTSCREIQAGDYLIPARPLEVPMIQRVALEKLAGATGDLRGTVIVLNQPGSHVAGMGQLLGIDITVDKGLVVGDRLVFWKDTKDNAPRELKGQGIVLSANGGGSTVKVIESNWEIEIGDSVERVKR